MTGAGKEPNKWEGEIFFYLDLVQPRGPLRTHRVSARRILGKPDISLRDKIKCLKKVHGL